MSEEAATAAAAHQEVDLEAEEAVPTDSARIVVLAFHLGHLDGRVLHEDQPNDIFRLVLLKMLNTFLRGDLRFISDDKW